MTLTKSALTDVLDKKPGALGPSSPEQTSMRRNVIYVPIIFRLRIVDNP